MKILSFHLARWKLFLDFVGGKLNCTLLVDINADDIIVDDINADDIIVDDIIVDDIRTDVYRMNKGKLLSFIRK